MVSLELGYHSGIKFYRWHHYVQYLFILKTSRCCSIHWSIPAPLQEINSMTIDARPRNVGGQHELRVVMFSQLFVN
jgi:hypothetical protein